MDQETAKSLFIEGGTFIFLNVPEGTEFGIDMKSWNTGERFRGVKMIPPGLHYIFYSNVDKLGDTAPRIGFFHYFHKGEVLVKKWDKETEDISLDQVSEHEVAGLTNSLFALDKFLGPYPYDILEKWESLTSHLTVELTKVLIPESGKVRSALELISKEIDKSIGNVGDGPSTSKHCKRGRINSQEDKEDDLLPDLIPVSGTELRVTKLPERGYPEGATAAEITQHHLDSSYVLEVMVKSYKNQNDFIGELQFCYVCFLVGHSLEAFEHWKKLIGLLCSCETGIKKFRGVYDAFITVLEVQIQEIPEEFLADIVSNNNYVYAKLRNFFRAVIESDVDGRLKSKAERFKKKLSELYTWDFSHLMSEDEDDAPVVVELDEVNMV